MVGMFMPVVSTTRLSVPRAARLPLNLPVKYRVDGDEGWSYGMTLNISSSGLLFRSGRVLRAHVPVDIQVVLHGNEEGCARVISRGSVIRVSKAVDAARDHVIAAKLEASELIRTPRERN